MYQGKYHGKAYHPPDLDKVLKRSWSAGVEKLIITAGSLSEAKAALKLARTDDRLFCTAGVHPTRCGELEQHSAGPEAYLEELAGVLQQGAAEGKIVAVGECGLDYDRLEFCDRNTQLKYFAAQFDLAASSGLPMFLHLRAAAEDFVRLLHEHRAKCPAGGVVHSFDGTQEELAALLEFDNICIGINGCSLKTEANLDVVAAIPADRLMLETDSPWCDIRPTHAGRKYVQTSAAARDKKKHDVAALVKGRNEPCNIRQVLEVVAGHRGVTDMEGLAQQVSDTTERMFFKQAS
ncbi:hypothetical protein WJX72_003337 [[Myrmecia] bisecta]|uniref:Uncharacterized protein n=1 Tax=[Myrmecia] bisecta TaxID=41462 RepID=A0AAW1P3M5_9CHLO